MAQSLAISSCLLGPSVSYKRMNQECTHLIKNLLLEIYTKWQESNCYSNRCFHLLPWEFKRVINGPARNSEWNKQQMLMRHLFICCCFETGAAFRSLTGNKAFGVGNCLYSPGRSLRIGKLDAVTAWMYFLFDYWESCSCLNEPIRKKELQKTQHKWPCVA